MKIQEIIQALTGHAGEHIFAVWERPMKVRKSVLSLVTKRVTCHVRSGIDFARLTNVKQGIESGERGEVQSLPWGQWAQFPLWITHKGKDYIRLYPQSFGNIPLATEYFIDGIPAEKSAVEPLCLASEFSERETPDCFTVTADYVIAIGRNELPTAQRILATIEEAKSRLERVQVNA